MHFGFMHLVLHLVRHLGIIKHSLEVIKTIVFINLQAVYVHNFIKKALHFLEEFFI